MRKTAAFNAVIYVVGKTAPKVCHKYCTLNRINLDWRLDQKGIWRCHIFLFRQPSFLVITTIFIWIYIASASSRNGLNKVRIYKWNMKILGHPNFWHLSPPLPLRYLGTIPKRGNSLIIIRLHWLASAINGNQILYEISWSIMLSTGHPLDVKILCSFLV